MIQYFAGDPSEWTEHRLQITYEEFLAIPGEHAYIEWVDGETIVSPPTDERHQDLLGFLLVVVGCYAEQHRLGKVLMLPFEVRLARSARVPDLLFVAKEHDDRLASGLRLDGPPDLIVEIMSDLSAARDRGEKARDYAEAGVPEYWLVDSRLDHNQTEFLRLETDGRYRAIPPGPEGRVHSRVLPGFWLRPEWLTRKPLPKELAVLWAIMPEAVKAVLESIPEPTDGLA